MSDTLSQALALTAQGVEELLDLLLTHQDAPEERLLESMRYVALGPGKRLRPFFVLQTASLFHVDKKMSLRVAAAVELAHCYSLVHDDLPAMDDDALRRGRPSAHIAFDEATAILSGNALLTLAFEILADEDTHPSPSLRCRLVQDLARSLGVHGMASGQMIDVHASSDLDIGSVTRMHSLKTKRLIEFSCFSGALMGHASNYMLETLRGYSHGVGLAFQIIDDLLDVEENEEGDQKVNFVTLLGVERSWEHARLLTEQAASHLDVFGSRARLLREMAFYILERGRHVL